MKEVDWDQEGDKRVQGGQGVEDIILEIGKVNWGGVQKVNTDIGEEDKKVENVKKHVHYVNLNPEKENKRIKFHNKKTQKKN